MLTRSDVSILAVRLLALYLILRSIGNLPTIALLWNSGDLPVQDFAYAAAMVMPVFIGLLALLFSRKLSRGILPAPEEPDEASAWLSAIQSIAIGTFGLFLIAASVPNAWARYLEFAVDEPRFASGEATPFYKDPYLVGDLVSCALGVALFTGAAFWTRLFTRFRDMGYPANEAKSD
jgi:O-antigen/teichoic acid export membrane protein